MIRGPVLPQLRTSVWAQLAGRLGSIERGLTLVVEGIDCSAGQFGHVEGLARDAMGAPVLVLVAVDGDGLLAARAHAACEFLTRIGDALPTAVPEADLVAGARGRVLVIGTDTGAASLDLLCRLPLPGLEVCRLETFRVAGSERLAVRWLGVDGSSRAFAGSDLAAPAAPEFEVPIRCREAWEELRQLCERIDPGVAWSGDRFSRRVTWQGRLLGRIEVDGGDLYGYDAQGARHAMRGGDEARRFVDRLLRRYSQLAGLGIVDGGGQDDGRDGPTTSGGVDQATGAGSRAASAPRVRAGDSLRATLTTRLSAEEYSALGEPVAGESAAVEPGADVAAENGPWQAQRRTE